MVSNQSHQLWILFALIMTVLGTEYDCTWQTGNASFDLCEWRISSDSQNSGYWEVYDERDDSSDNNYTYLFNICADVFHTKNLNELCINNTLRRVRDIPTGYCDKIINGSYGMNECQSITPIINSAAYQMKRRKSDADKHCYRLHDGITSPTFSLIDDYDPTIGASIKYIGGDWCEKHGKNREFVINFHCVDNFENVPDKDEKISEPSDDENNGCSYILEIDSTIGCPLECSVVDGKLCSGNGICQYDETNVSPKCFCYENWYGKDCSLDSPISSNVEIQHNDTKDIILLIFIVVVLTVLMVIIIYLSYNIYAVKMNTTIGISDEDIPIDSNNNDDNNDNNNNNNNNNNKEDKKVKKLKSQLAQQQLLNEDNDDHPIVV